MSAPDQTNRWNQRFTSGWKYPNIAARRTTGKNPVIGKKVAMLGMWGVGKTSLVQQFVASIYSEKYLSTIGVKVDKKKVTAGDRELNLLLWDIAGTEDHFKVPLHYIKGASGYLLVIDGTRRESLTSALDIIEMVNEGVGKIPFVAVVNKNDLPWELSHDEIDAALADHGGTWFSTSAKTGEQVDEAFTALAVSMLPK